jgi:hypothetical protein
LSSAAGYNSVSLLWQGAIMKYVLVLLAGWTLLTGMAHAATDTSTVTGVVYQERDGHPGRGDQDPGIAGVQVSNGLVIVRTDGNGRYRLPVRDGQTVFVIKPDDYVFADASNGLPRYWRHYAVSGAAAHKYPGIAQGTSAGDWDFALLHAPIASGAGFQVLVFTDTQVTTPSEIDYYQRDIVAPIQGRYRARMGTTLGDLVNDDLSLYPGLNAVTRTLGVPWFHVPGNHDVNYDASSDIASLDSWRAMYGPDTYAVNEGGASFLFLDDIVFQPAQGKNARPGYIGGLREDQFTFLEAYLQTLPRQRLLVLNLHIPLFDAAPGRQTFRHADRERLFALLRDFNNVLVLSGHSHKQRHYYHAAAEGWHGAKPLHEYNVGAACGAFWSGISDDQGIPAATMSDGTPNGYAVLNVKPGGGYALDYHAARDPNDAQLALHAPKVLRQGAYPAWGVYANVFMGQDDTRVELRIDGGAWQPMRRVEQADPALLVENVRDDLADSLRSRDRSPEATASTHLWRGGLPTTLDEGEHQIEVQAWLPGGVVKANTRYRLLRER